MADHLAGKAAALVPRLSIIIPMYNAEGWIPRCLGMLADQTLASYEAIFIDECSKDSSAALIEKAAHDDSRIRLVRQERNGGPGAARNIGIDAAEGALITFLDVDDRYGSPDYLESLCDALGESGLKVSAASFANEHESGKVESTFPEDGLFWGCQLREEGPVEFASFQFDYGFHRFVFARSLFENGSNRFPSLRHYEDPVFLARILAQAGSFFALPDQVYLYQCNYRKPNWDTRRALDLLEGVRQNLRFSREEGLARLHWVTAGHLDWEYGQIGVGVKPGLDLDAISHALEQVEAEVDEALLAAGGPVDLPFRFGLRAELDSIPGRSAMQVLLAKAKYSLVNGALWHRIRPLVKG